MISVIVCSIDERKFAAIDATYRHHLAAGANSDFEIIRIPDARSMCEGYNRGIAQSRGEVLIFSHDDIEIHAADFRHRLLDHLDRCDLAGVAGTTLVCGPAWAWAGPPHVYGQVGEFHAAKNIFEAALFAAPSRHVENIQALDGMFIACHRRVVEQAPFDEQTFTGFHLYDIDFTYRAFRAGMKLGVCCDLDMIHFSSGSWDEKWRASAERFLQKHAATVPQRQLANWSRTSVRVATREHLLPCFRPPHWD